MDKSQAAGYVQALANMSTTRFAALPEQDKVSDSTTHTGSPKSLHRSLTDVDAARRQQHQGASHAQQGPLHTQQAAPLAHMHSNGAVAATSSKALLHTAEMSAHKHSDAAAPSVPQVQGNSGISSNQQQPNTAAASSSEAAGGSNQATYRELPDPAAVAAALGRFGEAPLTQSAASPGQDVATQSDAESMHSRESASQEDLASHSDETSKEHEEEAPAQPADLDFTTRSAAADIDMLAARTMQSPDMPPREPTDDRQTETKQLHIYEEVG